jgi:hypothetical protein
MAKAKSTPKTKTVHRNSKNGEFVPEQYAKKHPATTETERVRINGNKK